MAPAPVTVHTAGPVEANGDQRCLGCDLLLTRCPREGTPLFRTGQMVGYQLHHETEKFSIQVFPRRRKLRAYETPCYALRQRPEPMSFEPVAAE